MPKVHLSNVVTFLKSENPRLNVRGLVDHFTYPNPKFEENLALGFNNFATPKTITVASRGQDRLELPRGVVSVLKKLLRDLRIADETVTVSAQFPSSRIVLKDFQVPAVAALLQRNQGVLVGPPGSGKTLMAIEAVLRRGQRTLWLTHTKTLLQQTVTRMHEWTGLTAGTIDASRFDVRLITVGMVQSLYRPLVPSFVEQFGCVVLDECHHVPAETFRRLVDQFPARYRIGLTATPYRRDGLNFLVTATMGPIIYTVEKNVLIENGHLLRPRVKAIHTDLYLPDCLDYRSLIEAATESSDRNDLILRHVAQEANDHLCLVLSERVKHVHQLHKLFVERHPDLPAKAITGATKKDERVNALDALRNGKIRALFASRIADEGLDVIGLDRLFLTCPIRFSGKVTQQVGRIMRVREGKQQPIVFDFVDSLIGLAKSQWHSRQTQVYQDFEIEEVEYQNGNTGYQKAV